MSASVGTPPATPAGHVDPAAYGRIRDHLTRSISHPVLFDGDTRDVRQELSHLSAPDFRATVQRMHHDGLLGTFVDEAPSSERAAFLRDCLHQGMVTQMHYNTPRGAMDPPHVPGLYVQDRNLPAPLREAMHERNIELAHGYDDQYRGYIDRYRERVMAAPTGEAVRQLGAPAEHAGLPEPGVNTGHPDYDRLTSDWSSRVSEGYGSTQPAYVAISDRMHDLTGRRRPGEGWVSMEAELGLHGEGAGFEGGAGVNLRAEARTSGRVVSEGLEPRASMRTPGGGTVEVGAGREGVQGSVGVEGGGNAMRVESNGTLDVQVAPTGEHGPRGFTRYNPHEATVETGVRLEAERGPVRGGVSVGVGIALLSPEDAHDAGSTDSPGTFHQPREVDQGVAWADLSARRREMLQRQDYTEAEWGRMLEAARRR